jgi:hypothetical protein
MRRVFVAFSTIHAASMAPAASTVAAIGALPAVSYIANRVPDRALPLSTLPAPRRMVTRCLFPPFSLGCANHGGSRHAQFPYSPVVETRCARWYAPRPVIEKLAGAAKQVMHAPEAIDTLRKQGYDPVELGPDQFGAFIRSELARWSAVARAASLKG